MFFTRLWNSEGARAGLTLACPASDRAFKTRSRPRCGPSLTQRSQQVQDQHDEQHRPKNSQPTAHTPSRITVIPSAASKQQNQKDGEKIGCTKSLAERTE